MTDFSRKPEIEYDDSAGVESLTLTWWAEDRRAIFSVILRDGAVMGVTASMDPTRHHPLWRMELPKGLIKIASASDLPATRDKEASNG
jgi:hypothetical protein